MTKINVRDLKLLRKLEEMIDTHNIDFSFAHEAITVSDPHLEDEPLIYANRAFLELTGYAEEEILNKNCRFLQGEDTDPEAIKKISTAITNEQPITITIENYKKDGSKFWNKVTVAPLYNEEGELVYFIGVQRDVSEMMEHKENMEGINEDMEAFLSKIGVEEDLIKEAIPDNKK